MSINALDREDVNALNREDVFVCCFVFPTSLSPANQFNNLFILNAMKNSKIKFKKVLYPINSNHTESKNAEC